MDGVPEFCGKVDGWVYVSVCPRWSVRTCTSWSVYQKLKPVGEVVTCTACKDLRRSACIILTT